MTALPETALHVRVTGKVQGVSFRAWTQGKARALGLEGWVRNEPDGSVTAVIAGPAAAVAEMVEAMHTGPRWSKVTGVETTPAAATDVPPGFHVTH